MKLLILTTTLVFAVLAQALEPQDPKSLCDRFLGGDQESCEKKVSELKPDWYLAAVCNRQFDDKLFYECIGLSAKHSFSPINLEPCDAQELNDMDRMKCVEGAKTTLAKSYQPEKISRKPANLPKKN
jgi:hypothetical protein